MTQAERITRLEETANALATSLAAMTLAGHARPGDEFDRLVRLEAVIAAEKRINARLEAAEAMRAERQAREARELAEAKARTAQSDRLNAAALQHRSDTAAMLELAALQRETGRR